MEMNVLDEQYEQSNIDYDPPYMPVVIKYGAIGSGILIVLTALTNLFGVGSGDMGASVFISIFLGFLNIVAYVVIMTFAALNYKKLAGGFMAMGRAFVVTYLTGVMMAVVSVIFSIIWIAIFGLPQQSMEQFSEFNSLMENDNATFMMMAGASLLSLLVGCGLGALVALVISVATKRDRPINFNV